MRNNGYANSSNTSQDTMKSGAVRAEGRLLAPRTDLSYQGTCGTEVRASCISQHLSDGAPDAWFLTTPAPAVHFWLVTIEPHHFAEPTLSLTGRCRASKCACCMYGHMPQVRRVRLAAVLTALSAWAAVLGQAPDRCPEPHKRILNEYKRFHSAPCRLLPRICPAGAVIGWVTDTCSNPQEPALVDRLELIRHS